MIPRRAGLLLAQTLIGAALLAAWLWVVDLNAVLGLLSRVRWPLLLLAATLAVGSGALRSWRWRCVLRPIARVPFLELWAISLSATLVNFVVPLRTGEVARGWLLKRRHSLPFAAALPTIAVDRAFDLLAVLALGAAGALLGAPLERRLVLVLWAGGALLLTFLAVVGLARRMTGRSLGHVVGLLPRRLVGSSLQTRVVQVAETVARGLSTAAQQPKESAIMTLLSLAAFSADAAGVYLLFLALAPPAPFTVVMTGVALQALTFVIPGAPGYIGSTEAFGSFIFSSLGIGVELAAGAVLLGHGLTSLLVVVQGGIALGALGVHPAATWRSLLGASRAAAAAQPGPEA